jgi:hypothetical protein
MRAPSEIVSSPPLSMAPKKRVCGSPTTVRSSPVIAKSRRAPLVDAQRLRPTDLDSLTDGRARGKLGHDGRHVLRSDQLHQPGR